MPRNLDGDRPMTDAERQARYRAARAAGKPVVRARRPLDRRITLNNSMSITPINPGDCARAK